MTVYYLAPGIIIDDIVFPDGRTQMGTLGGGGAQAAWGMALAAESGGQVGMLAGVGRGFPPEALAPLAAMGIDLTGVHVTDLPTPRAWQILEADGRRTHVWRVDQATSDRQTHPDAATILSFYPAVKVIHWGIHPEAPYLAPCQALRERGVLVSVEPFKAVEQPPTDDEIAAILTRCDIYSPNWAEATSFFGTDSRPALLERARALGGRILALRLGLDGGEVWDLYAGEGVAVPPAPSGPIVDPVGAGDAFCGAFAVTWHRTGDLAAAAVSASVAASYLLEQVGLPTSRPPLADQQARAQAVRAGLRRLTLPQPA